MEPLRIFIGYDHRQPVAYTALAQSIFSQSSRPVAITPLVINQLPLKRTGLTPFTFSRFLVPWLCDYKGWALFLDIDMILNHNISDLFSQVDDRYTVMVVKNEKRFEWASVMLMNCDKCTILTPDYVETADDLHRISWCKEEEIGALPSEWNHLVGYDKPRSDAKLIHYTQGVPAFPETRTCEHADMWRGALGAAISATNWAELMGKSVHTAMIQPEKGDAIPVPRYFLDDTGEAIKPEFIDTLKDVMGRHSAREHVQ